MDLAYSPEENRFRDEVRAWITQNFDAPMRAMMAQSKNGYLDKEGQRLWQQRLYERGWVAPEWPVEYGGPDWTHTQRSIFYEECAGAGCPQVIAMGVKMVAYVLMKYGTAEQRARFLPPILRSEEFWCQGYSEPGSGSDLASLQMKAERGGDDYVLNGSKTWTTLAQWADWMFCLVRTSKESKPQAGISFLLIDMRSPGITVAPIVTLDSPMPGQQEINQVFFDNVRVPVSQLVGEEGQGWTCAKYLLEFERGNAWAPTLKHQLRKVREIALKEYAAGAPLFEQADFRRRYAELEIRLSAADASELRVFSGLKAGQSAGADANMLKLVATELQQDITELAFEAVGIYGQAKVRDTWAELQNRPADPRPGPVYAAPAAPAYFNYRKVTIYGGTSEIQRNIMSKILFGL
ncbi:MAG: acyl-CoA dehydrogenase [Hydrocarboniphaga sp.]|uniref:acyl-CoA dehydrogenase family protein n=1 Tax=Hydrocarboniphaga sp. TaxID=2033016 RepID=UPI0026123C7B|nr:acyl-CoA dehydrogenase family protein [Hydrocarboniphaga sp.]MDB5969967.1 acyl-CoA dehydrogenase [Hydrocarboniphaga sp.]